MMEAALQRRRNGQLLDDGRRWPLSTQRENERRTAREIYTRRSREYLRFVNAVLYPQGLRAFFRSYPLPPAPRVLDAGCGTGIVACALLRVLGERGREAARLDGFDLTPAMLDQFRVLVDRLGLSKIRLMQADALALDRLPADWRDYDLVMSSAMLEYLPRERLVDALSSLRRLMEPTRGVMLVFISRRNLLMRWMIRKRWGANTYSRRELSAAFERAGLVSKFRRFPFPYWHLNVWGMIAEGRSGMTRESSRDR